ncbi:MAG TPA: ABC transporter ATP-binding protein [Bryobacteraceae bacterium]|nr:ABC transporter ATP-binding protein [Bryobacteraceae bacterium]
MALIVCDKISKKFRRAGGQKLLREHLISWWSKPDSHDFYALKNVSFEVEAGESLAFVGGNGAGKSTLLSIVAGLAPPSEGSVTVNGRIAALLELGAGFHRDLTGAENLILNASLLGFTQKETDQLFESIVDFAGLNDVIHEPLRTYSSGMIVRLAFSVAVNVNPDILIVDEVLAVGDQAFQAKCFDRIREHRRAGRTFLFVSHAAPMVREFCDRAMWLDNGEMIMQGDAKEVLDAYQGRVAVSHGA